jgi:hypothetical protein
MAITLSSKTLELIESQMRNLGCANADEFVEKLICDEFPTFEVDLDLLDPETRAAIEEGDREIEQGLGRPWEEVREELRAKFRTR